MQGKGEGNAQPSVCVNKTKSVRRMPLRANRVHTQSFILPDAVMHAVSLSAPMTMDLRLVPPLRELTAQ